MKRVALILATILLSGGLQAAPGKDDEPLDPNLAFRPQARLVAGESSASSAERHGIDIEYRIADGYYLYRDRMRFEVSPATLLVGAAEFPPGIEVEDPFLGKSVIYRDRLVIHLPFMTSIARAGRYTVRITAQGCAENRICYAPFPQEVMVNIPPGYRVQDSPPVTRTAPR
jgi:thiol:disulfide interchange protein DsbD